MDVAGDGAATGCGLAILTREGWPHPVAFRQAKIAETISGHGGLLVAGDVAGGARCPLGTKEIRGGAWREQVAGEDRVDMLLKPRPLADELHAPRYSSAQFRGRLVGHGAHALLGRYTFRRRSRKTLPP